MRRRIWKKRWVATNGGREVGIRHYCVLMLKMRSFRMQAHTHTPPHKDNA